MSGPIPGHRPAFSRRRLNVPLYGGDWQQRINLAAAAVDEAEAELRDAEKRDRESFRTLADQPSAAAARAERDQRRAEHDALVAQAEAEGCLTVTMEALPRRKWLALMEKHPPRTDEAIPKEKRDADAEWGFNDDTLATDLVPASIIELSDPNLSVDDLLDEVSAAQWDLLYGAAVALNRSVGTAPKALSSPSLTSEST